MNDHHVISTIERLFQGSPRWQYSLLPEHLARISTKTLTALSDALDAGWVREYYLRSERMVELRMTRLGRRAITSYRRWKERAA